MKAQDMLRTHPNLRGQVSHPLVNCIEACLACANTCTSCADACLAEGTVAHLTQCIRLNLDCADICAATAAVLTRRTGSNEPVIRATLELCAFACQVCAEECLRHGNIHEHCRLCAQACRACQQACQAVLPEMSGKPRAAH